MSDSPETTQVVVTDSSPVARDDSNASDIPHADLLSALDKTPSTAMADIVSTQEVPEADVTDKEVVDVVSKDVPLQVAEDGLAGAEDSKVEGPAGTTLLATDGPAPIPPVQDTAVTEPEDLEDATVAKPTPVTVTEEETRPEAFPQEDTKEAVSTLPTIEPTGANDTAQVDAEDKAVADAKKHDTIHLTSTEEDDTEAAPTDTITIPTAATVPELHPLDSNTALLSSKDAIPTSELAEAKEDITIADPESTVQLVVPVDDVKLHFTGLEDGASQDELSSNQAESLTLQQGAVEGLLTDKDEQEPEISIEPEMTFAAPSSPILPAAKVQPPQEDVPALPQESEAVVAEPVVDTKDASPEAEAVPVVNQKAVEEVKDEEKPFLESIGSAIPVQDEPVAETTEDVITKDEPISVDAESKDEPVLEKVEAEEAAPVVEATEDKPEEEASALDQDQPEVEATPEEALKLTPSVPEETAAAEPVPEEEPVKEQQPAEPVAEIKPADALEVETDAVAAQEQPTVEETSEAPVVEAEPQLEAVDVATTTLDQKVEETVATEKDEVVDEVPSEAAAVPVKAEQEEPVQVLVSDEKPEPEPVKVEEEEKPAEVDESSKVEEPKADEPTVEKSEPAEALPETREPEPEPVKAEEPAEVEKPQEEPLKAEGAVESAEPVPAEKAVEHEATEEPEEQPASVEEHERNAAEVKEVEQEAVNAEVPEEKAAEPAESAEVIEKAPAQVEEPENAASEVDQTATEPIKARLWDAQTGQQPLKGEELEEKEPVESELEQKPLETEVLEKDLVEEEIVEHEAEPVKEEPEQKISVQVDSAEEAGKAEELEQVPETIAEEDQSLTVPQLAAHSVTATDSSADSVDEPITPSVVVQDLEAIETSGNDEVGHTAEPAVATGEIERPKSPWTPSFTVSTLGGPAPEAEQDDAKDEPKPEQAVVSLLVTDDDGKVQAPEESTPAPPARPWTPSYSVHSQGSSPVLKSVELEDEVPEVPASSWTPSYSVHSQGNSPIQRPTELEDEVPEAPLTKEAETSSHVPPVDEVAVHQPAEVPVLTQPIVESATHKDAPSEDVEVSNGQSARVDNADSPVLKTASAPEEDTGTVEKTTIEPIADTTLASNVDTVGSDEVAPVVPNEVNTETAGVDEVENKVEPVSKVSEEPEESTSAATPETDEAASETPKLALVEETPAEEAAVPSVGESSSATDVDIVSPVPLVAPVPVVGSSTWVPSYSVSRQGSRQGSPLPRPQDTVEDDGATAAKESAPAAEVVEDTVQKDISAISETETNAISAPAGGQEAVTRSWTPSYSVTTQGPIAEPDLSAAQDGNASSAAPEEQEIPIASDIEEPQASGPRPETLKEASPNGAAVPAEDAEAESSSGVSPTHETPVVASTSDPLETRKRLESTASSRFFPGSWFSAAAKPPVPEEGRASLETASGQFSRGPSSPLDTGAMLSPITINTENLAVPEGEHTEDSAVSPSKRKWCSIM